MANLESRLKRLEDFAAAETQSPLVLEFANDEYQFLLLGHPWHGRTISADDLKQYQTKHPQTEITVFDFNPDQHGMETTGELMQRMGDNWREELQNYNQIGGYEK